jgi:hypothetical protein
MNSSVGWKLCTTKSEHLFPLFSGGGVAYHSSQATNPTSEANGINSLADLFLISPL